MKAVVHQRYGSAAALELREIDVPPIADDQVLVRVHASSVNPAEWYTVMGPIFARVPNGLRRPKSNKIGADLAGRVVAVGGDITEFQPGDEVFGTSGHSWAEYAPAREVRLVRKPTNISFEEAGAVPIAALTALQGLRDHGHVERGMKVLINGASGGVGTYAVQLAKSFGADVTAVCSPRNVEQASSLGADRVCNYAEEDFTQSSERYDLMLDIAGSRPFSKFRRVLKPKATVVVIGAKMSAKGLGPLKHIAGTRVTSIGRSQTVKFFVAKINKDDLGFLADLLAAGTIRSVIDRRFDLDHVADALGYLGEGHARGKIVVVP